MSVNEVKAICLLIASVAIGVLIFTLATIYGLYILYGLAGIAGLAAIRFGVMPILKSGAEIFDMTANTVIKIQRHRQQKFIELVADGNGNYSQIINARTGQVISLLAPGNSPHPVKMLPARSMRDYDYETTAEEIEEPLQIAAPSAIDPATVTAPSMREELQRGLIQPGNDPDYGYKIVTDPFTNQTVLEPITMLHKSTAFLVGWSGSGKSALISVCAARFIVAHTGRAILLVVDPHKGNEEKSITAKISPALDNWIYQPKGGAKITGKNEKDLQAVVNFLNAEKKLRLERDDLTIEEKRRLSPVGLLPIWVIVDEALSFARDARVNGMSSVFGHFMALMQSLATETAKAEITAVYMAQLGAKKQLGDMEIRDVCPTQIVLRTPADQAETLGLTATEAKIAHRFPQGRGYIADGGEPEIFVWGYGGPEELAQAVEGLPSPLIPEWKQAGNNVINLHSNRSNFLMNDYTETTWKEDGNEIGNKFPAALQAKLDQIPNWQAKLAALEELIGADRRDIWQALFGRAPGGRSNTADTAMYEVLLEAFRFQYRQSREAL